MFKTLLLFLLAASMQAVACARPVKSQRLPSWQQVAKGVAQEPVFRELPLEVVVSHQISSGSPLSIEWKDGRCRLLVKTYGNPMAKHLLALVEPADQAVWMQAVVVHELAHCWRIQDSPESMQALFALASSAETDPRLTASLNARLRQEESFADVTALAWVEQRWPGAFETVLRGFERLRQDARFASEQHDSRTALARIRKHGMLYGETPFLAADATLAALREGRSWSTLQQRRMSP